MRSASTSTCPPAPSPQAFFLRLNNHHGFLTGALADLYRDQAMVDVTLTADGQMIRAHRIILAACSSYFRDILAQLHNNNQYPVVVLKDMSFADLTAIIEFIYRGEITIPREQLDSLLKNGASLKIKGLVDVNKKAVNFDDSLSKDNCASTSRNEPEREKAANEKIGDGRRGKKTRKRMTSSKETGNKAENAPSACDETSSSSAFETDEPNDNQQTCTSEFGHRIIQRAKVIKLSENDETRFETSNKEVVGGRQVVGGSRQQEQQANSGAVYLGRSDTNTGTHSALAMDMTIDQPGEPPASSHRFQPFQLMQQSMLVDSKQDVDIQAANDFQTGPTAIFTSQPFVDKMNEEENNPDDVDDEDADDDDDDEDEENFDDSSGDIPLALIAPRSVASSATAFSDEPVQGVAGDQRQELVANLDGLKTAKLKISRAGIPVKGTSTRSQKKYTCPVCYKIYVSPQNMKEHVRNTHTNPNEKYTCSVCGKEYTWRHALDRHVKTKHKTG